MKALTIIWICIALLGNFTHSYSQELPSSAKQQLENLADVTEEATEDDALIQQLAYLKDHPLDINIATMEDLQAFYFLNDFQIQNFISYRAALGNLISIYEMQSVPSWDLLTINKIVPYIIVQQPGLLQQQQFKSRFIDGEHSLLFRASRILEQSKGFLNAAYPGDRNHLLTRYRYQYKNLLQYGITADKDSGEPFSKGRNSRGFDFYSFHLFAKNIGAVKSIALGDFTINLGQGLIQWQSLAFKKGAEVLSIKRQGAVLKPYTSAGEFYFNRGAGITVQKNNLEATLFASIKNISANTAFDSTGKQVFTSFLTSGLHRTVSEIEDKNSIHQTSYGSNIRYHKNAFSVGLNFVQYNFSREYEKREEPYNLFALKGNEWHNASIDYSFTHKNIHFFGEAALDKNGDKAFVNGVVASLHSKIDLSLFHRIINKGYQAVYGNAFTENIQPNNESGLYMGICVRPQSYLKIDAYADFYQFPWLRYRVDAPGGGKDYLLQVTYQPNRIFEIYSRYRYEAKEINEMASLGAMNYLRSRDRQNWRTHFSYTVSSKLALRGRADIIWYDKKGKFSEEGFLIFTEMHYKANATFSGNMRLQYFATDSYNSRLYAFENDVLFSYSIPAFFNRGLRYYGNVHYQCSQKVSLWLRWAQTLYNDGAKIGSGLDEIEDRRRTEVKIQLFYRL